MNNNSINVDINSTNLEDILKEALENCQKEQFKHIINVYYSLATQRAVNDKKYLELEKLEGLLDLHRLIDSTG